MFLEVAFPLPLLQTFTYRCPPSLFHHVQPGQRILAPFRNQRVAGFVIRKFDQAPRNLPSGVALKEVLDLIDPSSLISAELLQLAEWVGEYYFASRGEVLRACLPPKAGVRTETSVALKKLGLDALERSEQNAELSLKQRQLLHILREHQCLTLKALAERAGFEVGERDLRVLILNQYVQIQHQLAKPAVSARFQKNVALRPESDFGSLKLKSQQDKVVQTLKARQGPVPVAELLEELSISDSVLNTLHRRGLIAFSSEDLRPRPLKGILASHKLIRREHTFEQSGVLDELLPALSGASFVAALLHGVTGSGKTEVYLCLIEAILQHGKAALMLMPEIGLTPRVAEEFRQR